MNLVTKKNLEQKHEEHPGPEKAMAQVREAIAKLNAQKASEKEACDVLDDQIQACTVKLFHICTSKDSTEGKFLTPTD